MNREETIEAIKVMQAWADGRMVQFRYRMDEGKWTDPKELSWNWCRFEYRIKPEPREWWLGFDIDGGFGDCILDGEKSRKFCANLEYVKVREVL